MSLDAFITHGSTGFSPRDGEAYDAETSAAVDFLKGIGVKKMQDAAFESLMQSRDDWDEMEA